uniref:Uncharacterized protein n=1 Tax=Oryza meridionalis TaxID=40149 RepID=A0A0E0DQT5_9ORYZ
MGAARERPTRRRAAPSPLVSYLDGGGGGGVPPTPHHRHAVIAVGAIADCWRRPGPGKLSAPVDLANFHSHNFQLVDIADLWAMPEGLPTDSCIRQCASNREMEIIRPRLWC